MIDKLKTKITERLDTLKKSYFKHEQEGKHASANQCLAVSGNLRSVLDELSDFDSFLETYFEIVRSITLAWQFDTDSVVTRRYTEQGSGGLYDLAKQWTNEFQSLYEGREWDGEWLDTITDFFNSKNKLT